MRARIAVVVAMLCVIASCGTTGDRADPEEPQQLGQEIVVTGSVHRPIDATGFVLRTDDDVRGLLVVAPSQVVTAADVVEVRGVVRRFERRAVEREVRRPLDERRYGEFEGRDFISARRVVVRS